MRFTPTTADWIAIIVDLAWGVVALVGFLLSRVIHFYVSRCLSERYPRLRQFRSSAVDSHYNMMYITAGRECRWTPILIFSGRFVVFVFFIATLALDLAWFFPKYSGSTRLLLWILMFDNWVFVAFGLFYIVGTLHGIAFLSWFCHLCRFAGLSSDDELDFELRGGSKNRGHCACCCTSVDCCPFFAAFLERTNCCVEFLFHCALFLSVPSTILEWIAFDLQKLPSTTFFWAFPSIVKRSGITIAILMLEFCFVNVSFSKAFSHAFLISLVPAAYCLTVLIAVGYLGESIDPFGGLIDPTAMFLGEKAIAVWVGLAVFPLIVTLFVLALWGLKLLIFCFICRAEDLGDDIFEEEPMEVDPTREDEQTSLIPPRPESVEAQGFSPRWVLNRPVVPNYDDVMKEKEFSVEVFFQDDDSEENPETEDPQHREQMDS